MGLERDSIFGMLMTAIPTGIESDRSRAALDVDVTARQEASMAAPAAWHHVFASLFTPTWSLGLLLFVCLFLPSYEGCSGQVVHVRDALTEELTTESFYPVFLVTWPYFFGLIVAGGTLSLAWSRRPERACGLWWWLSGLVILHAVLLIVTLAFEAPRPEEVQSWGWSDWLHVTYWLGTSVILVALIPITCKYCRTWFNAAMWLQLALVVTAAICLSFYIPALIFARKLLVGGRLAAACSVLLIVATIIEWLDGHRALTRGRGESPLRLSLKATLLLMVIGGLACAWAGAYLLFDIEF